MNSQSPMEIGDYFYTVSAWLRNVAPQKKRVFSIKNSLFAIIAIIGMGLRIYNARLAAGGSCLLLFNDNLLVDFVFQLLHVRNYADQTVALG